MLKKLLLNTLWGHLDKGTFLFYSLLTQFAYFRLFDSADYRFIALAQGWLILVGMFNFSFDIYYFRKYAFLKRTQILTKRYFETLVIFSYIRTGIISAITAGLAIIGFVIFDNILFVYCMAASVSLIIVDILMSPYATDLAARLQYRTIVAWNMLRIGLLLSALPAILYFPSIEFMAIKNIGISSLFLCIFLFTFRRKHPAVSRKSFGFYRRYFWILLRKIVFWNHLNGVSTSIVYKADLFIFGFYATSQEINLYAISILIANIYNLSLQQVSFQSLIGFSQSEEGSSKMLKKVFAFNFCIGSLILLTLFFSLPIFAFGYFGEWIHKEFFFITGAIMLGLFISKSLSGSILSYLSIHASVKQLSLNVLIPVCLFSAGTYWLAAVYGDIHTLALMNIFNGIFWLILLIVEFNKRKGTLQVSAN